MRHDYNLATENEYAYISELPPPPPTPSPHGSPSPRKTCTAVVVAAAAPDEFRNHVGAANNVYNPNRESFASNAATFCERKKMVTIVNSLPNGDVVTDCSWSYSEVSVDCGKYSVAQGCQLPYAESPKYFEFDPNGVPLYNGYAPSVNYKPARQPQQPAICWHPQNPDNVSDASWNKYKTWLRSPDPTGTDAVVLPNKYFGGTM